MKDKLTRGLPNSCAINAVALSWLTLARTGAPARILMMFDDDGEGHVCTVFQSPNGQLFSYDNNRGSRRMHGATMHWTPLRLAQRAYGRKIVSAKWILAPPKAEGGNRRLSPREVRSFLPSVDRLLEQGDAPGHNRGRKLSPRECRAFVPSFDRLIYGTR